MCNFPWPSSVRLRIEGCVFSLDCDIETFKDEKEVKNIYTPDARFIKASCMIIDQVKFLSILVSRS